MTARTAPGSDTRQDAAGRPPTMTAVVQHRYGLPSVLAVENVAVPDLGDRDVLLRVRAAGVNVADDIIMHGVPYLIGWVFLSRSCVTDWRGITFYNDND